MTENINTTRQRMSRPRSKNAQADMSRAYQSRSDADEVKVLQIRLPKELHTHLKHLSADLERSMSALIVEAVAEKYPTNG